jgi:hypothetical protein
MFLKSSKILKKYLSIVFLLSVFLTSFHHHNDLKPHPNCPICIIQRNITDADTPPDVEYIIDLDNKYEIILKKAISIYSYNYKNSLHQRAPPYNS